MKNEFILVLVTVKDKAQAKKIANALLKDKLIACANIIGNIESMFIWQGKIDKAREVLLVLKTEKNLFERITIKVKAMHSYQTPEIIALPIIMGDATYLTWIKRSLAVAWD